MNKVKWKKMGKTTLAAVLLAGSITLMPQGIKEIKAVTSDPKIMNINLGTSGIGNPTSTDANTATNWEGSKAFFGGRECYVLDKDGKLAGNSSVDGKMLLVTSGLLETQQAFDDKSNPDWSTSTIRNNLNDTNATNTKGFLNTLTTVEQNSLAETRISKDNTTGGVADYPTDSTLDKIFLLDLVDVENSDYGLNGRPRGFGNSKDSWWLRSSGSGADRTIFIYFGDIYSLGDIASLKQSVRPAFNLNLDSVFYTSAIGASKSDFSLVGEDKVNDTWKMTLKEHTEVFKAILPKEGKTGESITVDVKEFKGSDDYTQTSAMLTDGNGTVVAYGKIGDATLGEKTFAIPSTLTAGDYKLHVFQETNYGDNKTDYASQEIVEDIKIEVGKTSVNINAGTLMTKTTDSGSESQAVEQRSPITSVVYTANDGYSFPKDYKVEGKNGIIVTRDSNNQITVLGTPTANTTIDLMNPAVGYGVDIIPGEHMNIVSGLESQTVAPNTPITDVIYWIGGVLYNFPEDYKVEGKNGIVVTRVGDVQITVSGTPTANTTIKLKEPDLIKEYTINQGANSIHYQGSSESMTIKCSGLLESLNDIKVDNNIIEDKNYTLVSGSTILTLKSEYLDTLSIGKHTLTFVYEDQSVETTFEVRAAVVKAPDTGDTSSAKGLFVLFGLSGVMMCYIGRKKRLFTK